MRMQPGDYTQVIYDRGCLRSGEEWVERNLVPVAAVAVALAVLQASNKLQLFFFSHTIHSFCSFALILFFYCDLFFFVRSACVDRYVIFFSLFFFSIFM